MFEEFDRGRDERGKAKRWLASTTVAVLVYGGLGAGVLLFARTRPIVAEKEIDVSFEKTVARKEAPKPLPPPPPPPPADKPRPKVANVKPRPTPMIAPKEMPKEAPPEKDPGERQPSGDADGVVGGEPGGTGPVGEAPPPPPPPAPRRAEPINLPEEATPPVPASDNALPVFPEDARRAGTEGQVILKVVVTESGKVTNIQVLRGDPPFVDAAVAAVKTWTFEPARLDGKAIAVYRILKIPFRLSVGG